MASTPASRSARARSRTSASSRGTMISPLGAVTRSRTVSRWRRLTNGRDCHGSSCWSEKLCGFLWRAMCRMSRKPSVVIRPTSAPLCSSAMLVATVVPCSIRSTAWRLTPALPQRASTPVITARAGSSGVDGTLSIVIAPAASSTRIKSVKVPPTSTPMRRMVLLLRPPTRRMTVARRSLCADAPARGRSRLPQAPASPHLRRHPAARQLLCEPIDAGKSRAMYAPPA